MVDAPVLRYLQQRAVRAGVQWIDARRLYHGRLGAAGAGRPVAAIAREAHGLIGADAAWPAQQTPVQQTLVITGFIATDPRGVQTHARAQRQRFLGLDLRRTARCRGDPHLDRRRWRCCRPIRAVCPMPRSSIRFPTTKRWSWRISAPSHPSTDHGAGRRPRHPHLDPQHLCAAEAGHADLRGCRRSSLPVKGITSIENVAAGEFWKVPA